MDAGSIHGFRPLPTFVLFLTTMLVLGSRSEGETTPQPKETSPLFDFQVHGNKPVLPVGDPGEWDGSTIWGPAILHQDDGFHCFYTGNWSGNPEVSFASSAGLAIGYAFSKDGLTWTKSKKNPVYRHSIDRRASVCAVFVEDGTWHLIYNVPDASFLARPKLYHATSSTPTGPWTAPEPYPILVGYPNSWGVHLLPHTLLRHDREFRLYFAGIDKTRSTSQFGLARGPRLDELSFFDDPQTTAPELRSSDPILTRGKPGSWDSVGLTGGTILETDAGWELFYVGYNRPILTPPSTNLPPLGIGYATSRDGIHWTKHPSNPVIETPETGWPLICVVRVGEETWIYHDMSFGTRGIGLMRGTIRRTQ